MAAGICCSHGRPLLMQIGTGKRAFSKIEKQEKIRNERQRREIDEMKRLLPDRLNDPLLDVGVPSLPAQTTVFAGAFLRRSQASEGLVNSPSGLDQLAACQSMGLAPYSCC